ncbi:MAG: sigma-70 family RNA polymerase sigma factor [bacterium]|nr:sigma-70 family RNA polymerase sigma factor [bacterium]
MNRGNRPSSCGDALDSANDRLQRATRGDRTALVELLEGAGPVVRRRIAGDIPQRFRSVLSVDDVLQQTYVDAFLNIHEFFSRGGDAFVTWITTIAQRNLIDARRMLEAEKRGRGRQNVASGMSDDSFIDLYEQLGRTHTTPSRHASRREARVAIEKAIAELPPSYRRVVEMYDLQECPVDRVAEAMDRSTGAVFMLRARAHRLLRGALGSATDYLTNPA